MSVTSAGARENQKETIQLSPSPEFLNSPPFIKKFYPAPRWGEGKVTDITHDDNCNSCQYEPQQSLSVVIPSDSEGIQPINNSTQLQGKKNNSTETNHASMPLGIFASKSVSCRHSNTDLHKLKRAAFTLAEVLITLGIIGVVAALTLPSVIANYQEKQLITAWKKAYSDAANAALLMSQNNEDLSTEQKVGEAFAKYLKVDKVCIANKGVEQGCWRENVRIYYPNGAYNFFSDPSKLGGGSVCMTLTSGALFCIDGGGKNSILIFDVNGISKPNTNGKDIFYAIFNSEKYAIKPAKGYAQGWGAADCDNWVGCTGGGDGTCKGDFYGFGCSAEKLLK